MRLPLFKIEEYFAQYEFTTDYMLGSSDPETMTIHELLEMADNECYQLWNSLDLGYTETPGAPILRDTISELYETVERDNVLTFAGAEEAIFITMNTLIEPSDHVIVLTPCYQSLKTLPQAVGAYVTEMPLKWGTQGWYMDLEELEQSITQTTRMIVVNFPHNPTGYLPDIDTFNEIVGIAQKHNCYLFSDEVYRLSEHDTSKRLPNAADCYQHAISLSVMSKAFGLPGLRIGWIATQNSQLLNTMASYKLYTSICNSAPSEILALIGLRNRNQLLWRNINIANHNLDLLDRFFAKYRSIFEWQRPQAGFIAFPRLKSATSIDTFAQKLVEQESVLILPGTLFDTYNNHFRLGFGRRNMPEALERLDHYMENCFQTS